MENALSIDLEDWFCVSNMRTIVPPADWDRQEMRIVRNSLALLDLLDRQGRKATFFVLGWIAERLPDLIGRIAEKGHEIATHGYSHRLLTEMTPREFEADLRRALDVTEPLAGREVVGFRAPTFSLTDKTLWAPDILLRNGIRYDSSVFPMSFNNDYRGVPNLSLDVFRFPNGLIEFPLGCAPILGLRVPFAGGCFFRALPYTLTKWLVRRCNRAGRAVIFYLHPWEIDLGQPRMALPRIASLRHYLNLHKTLGRLTGLLEDFDFTSARKVLKV
jgi:polysaccharide deacetylase family protein (PEP-CTERM system associated)